MNVLLQVGKKNPTIPNDFVDVPFVNEFTLTKWNRKPNELLDILKQLEPNTTIYVNRLFDLGSNMKSPANAIRAVMTVLEMKMNIKTGDGFHLIAEDMKKKGTPTATAIQALKDILAIKKVLGEERAVLTRINYGKKAALKRQKALDSYMPDYNGVEAN